MYVFAETIMLGGWKIEVDDMHHIANGHELVLRIADGD
jgi:hypothetical protein